MNWTNKAPTEKGFYWAKQFPSHPQVVEVTENLTVWVPGHNVPVDITEFFHWSDRSITPPDDGYFR